MMVMIVGSTCASRLAAHPAQRRG